MSTGPKIVITTFFYIVFLFVIFAYIPIETHQIESGALLAPNGTFNASQDHTDPDNIETFTILDAMLSFSISDIPWWVYMFGVFVPVVLLIIGIYCLIRGI